MAHDMETVNVFTNRAVVQWGFISLRVDGLGSYHQQVTKLLPNWGPFRWYIIIWLTSGRQMRLNMDNMALRGGGGVIPSVNSFPGPTKAGHPRHTRKFVYRTRTAITSHTAHWTLLLSYYGISTTSTPGRPTSWGFSWTLFLASRPDDKSGEIHGTEKLVS